MFSESADALLCTHLSASTEVLLRFFIRKDSKHKTLQFLDFCVEAVDFVKQYCISLQMVSFIFLQKVASYESFIVKL